ncbi:MAG: methionyl-tRNA formyltransferase [Candidatus Izimaplasma sp.]|nr:methionyl-tRNA formyltransferase [Candidatus Izimaplasma bacterium]
MKIVFMGTPQFSVPILKAIHKEYGVSLVVTQPDKFVGRKKILTQSPVKDLAIELGIEVFQPKNIKKDYSRILDIEPDIIITAAYGQIIPAIVIDNPSFGAINVHGSLLPLLRGGAPIQRAIKRMYIITGVTIMYMTYKMDSGDIISQKSIPILHNDTSGILFEKLSYLGRDLLMETLPSIFSKTNKRIIQDEHLVTYSYNLKREEEKINWNLSVEEIDAHVRAFSPAPGCYTILDSKNIKLLSVEPFLCDEFIKYHEFQENGTIIKLFEDSIGVKCINGVIKIKALQLEGKKKQDVKTFMNGAGRNLIKVDKVFK